MTFVAGAGLFLPLSWEVTWWPLPIGLWKGKPSKPLIQLPTSESSWHCFASHFAYGTWIPNHCKQDASLIVPPKSIPQFLCNAPFSKVVQTVRSMFS